MHRVYPNLGTGSSHEGSQLSGLFLTTNSDSLETKGCISCDPVQDPEPNHAMQAFQLLDENPKIQVLISLSPPSSCSFLFFLPSYCLNYFVFMMTYLTIELLVVSQMCKCFLLIQN